MVMREGRVLVRIAELTTESVNLSGHEIAIKTIATTSIAEMSARHGTVIKSSAKTDIPYLNYSFKSDHEIEDGDEVWWSQSAIGKILKNNGKEEAMFECEGDRLIMIPYAELLLRRRSDTILALNDRVIAKKVMPKAHAFLDLSFTSLGAPVKDRYEVVHTPSFSGHYNNERFVNRCEPGDQVMVLGGGRTVGELEDRYNMKLDEEYVYFRSADITAIHD
jgi:hypothetical protein